VPAIEDFVFGGDVAKGAANFVAHNCCDLALFFGAASVAVYGFAVTGERSWTRERTLAGVRRAASADGLLAMCYWVAWLSFINLERVERGLWLWEDARV
jgi:hypothetical protein